MAGYKPWNRKVFNEMIMKYPGKWLYIESRDDLNQKTIKNFDPRYIFFLHWSWIVPDEIINNYECVCFHMTDVPFGRGGSPLQNLIKRGFHHTKLSALRMTKKLDAGPVYFKDDLCLEGSTAEEIYIRATYLSAKMIKQIITNEPKPVPQEGEGNVFKRRKPQESEIPNIYSLQELHDFIRMLDAEGYPKAFLKYKGYRYEFSRAGFYNGKLLCDVTIKPIKKSDS